MASQMFFDRRFMWLAGTVEPPGVRGRAFPCGPLAYSEQVLPTDSMGVMTLTLNNVVIGSTYEVEVASTGALVTSGTAAAATVALNIPVYSAGDVQNAVRIKLRKASAAPYYQPYETQALGALGAQSIFVNQLTDE